MRDRMRSAAVRMFRNRGKIWVKSLAWAAYKLNYRSGEGYVPNRERGAGGMAENRRRDIFLKKLDRVVGDLGVSTGQT